MIARIIAAIKRTICRSRLMSPGLHRFGWRTYGYDRDVNAEVKV
ncbi:hypothetical protein ACRAWG_30970 [Methylobacterium sp. P31]